MHKKKQIHDQSGKDKKKLTQSALERTMPINNDLMQILNLEWQDHFQTRAQTWKTLEIEAALVIGLVGINWQLGEWAALIFSMILFLAACFGFLITIRHRNDTEIRKFTHILNIEEHLNLHQPHLLPSVKVPNKIRFRDVFFPWKSNTSLFILRMHVVIAAFAIIYGVTLLLKILKVM